MGTPEIDMETGPKDFQCTGDPFEGLDDKPKKLFQDCQDLNQTSIEDSLETLEEETLKQTDKNGMNIFPIKDTFEYYFPRGFFSNTLSKPLHLSIMPVLFFPSY